MSDQQRGEIKAVLAEQENRQREMFQSMSNLPRHERREFFGKLREMRTQTESKALEVLTPEQQSEFNKLKGARFEIDRRRLFGGFGRPGGQGQRRVRPPVEP